MWINYGLKTSKSSLENGLEYISNLGQHFTIITENYVKARFKNVNNKDGEIYNFVWKASSKDHINSI